MINKILFYITGNLPCRLIKLDDKPYLERYYLGVLFGITFYLHRFVSVDAERNVHNHPWWWSFSIILSGWYREAVAVDLCPAVACADCGCVLEHHKRRWFNSIKGNTFHRIEELAPNTWTLFFHGERAVVGHEDVWVRGVRVRQPLLKGWGFLERQGPLTVFRPFTRAPDEKLDWWTDAPIGAAADRVPLPDAQREALRRKFLVLLDGRFNSPEVLEIAIGLKLKNPTFKLQSCLNLAKKWAERNVQQ